MVDTTNFPALTAVTPDTKVSAKYSFISTATVIEVFKSMGWYPTRVSQTKVKIPGRAPYAKHMVEFQNVNFPATPALGDSVPRILLTNSHDGSSSFVIRMGLIRLVCSNGLVVGTNLVAPIRIRHVGYTPGLVYSAVNQIEGAFNAVSASLQRMLTRDLTPERQLVFANAALKLRYPEGAPINPSQLLSVHRPADVGNTVWQVFNRIQENLIRGGARYQGVAANGRVTNRTMRGIRSIDANTLLNTQLWALAEAA